MMEEFSVLLDEHRAMDTCAARLMDAMERHCDQRVIGAFLRPLAWMASRVHAPKEDAAWLGRLGGDRHTNAALVKLMADRWNVEQELMAFSEAWDTCDTAAGEAPPGLLDTVRRFTLLMEAEERLVYPTVYARCTDDDLWRIGVDLDRKVDHDGRDARADFIRQHTHVA